MIKNIVVGAAVSLVSVGAFAQLSDLLQSAKNQMGNAVQSELNQSVNDVTEKAVQTTKEHIKGAIEGDKTPTTADQSQDTQSE